MDFPSCLRHDCLSCLKARTLLRASTSSKPGLSFVPPPGLSLYLKAWTFLGVQPGYNNINISISIRSLFNLYSISTRSLSLLDLYLISISIRSQFDLYLYSISIWSLSLFDLYSISMSIRSLFDLYLYSISIRSLFDLYLYSISLWSLSLFNLFIRSLYSISLFVLFIRSLFILYSTTHHLILLQVSFYFCKLILCFLHIPHCTRRGVVSVHSNSYSLFLCVFIFKFSCMFVLLLCSLPLSFTSPYPL